MCLIRFGARDLGLSHRQLKKVMHLVRHRGRDSYAAKKGYNLVPRSKISCGLVAFSNFKGIVLGSLELKSS